MAEERELIRLLADTLEQVRANYVDRNVSERELVEAAIRGMIAKLDPYSDYIEPQALDQFRKGLEHEFVGIGIQVSEQGDELVIASPLYGTPAWQAGLRAGDRIFADRGHEHARAVAAMMPCRLMPEGDRAREVSISVRRVGQVEPHVVTLQREMIQQPTVTGLPPRMRRRRGTYFCDDAKQNRVYPRHRIQPQDD